MEYSQSEEALQLSHLASTPLTATVLWRTLSLDQIRGGSWEDDENLLPARPSHSRPRAYQQPEQSNETPAVNHVHEQKRSIRAIGVAQTLALFWLLPIVALIVLNLRGFVIGASAWCPQGRCYSDNYNTTLERGQFEKTRASLEMSSRNLVGALQLAAKVLEMWFTLITTSLVYMLTMNLAKDGLPIKYILRPSEFTEISGFFDTTLWRTPFLNPDRHRIHRMKLPDLMLSAFLLVTVILCILCNLMGPAVAVLIIPSQQWFQIEPQQHNHFVSLEGEQPPSKSFSDKYDCNSSFLATQNYSCATKWAAEFDQSIAYVSDLSFLEHHEGLSFLIVNESFSGNTERTLWAPNRRVLGALSDDVTMLHYATRKSGVSNATRTLLEMNQDWLRSCSRSLQTFLRRTGPILGAQTAQVHVVLYATGHAAYLRRDELTQIVANGCLVNGTIQQDVECDWEAFFEPRSTDHETFHNTYGFLNTLEVSSMGNSSYLSLTADFVSLLTFAEYELNPSLHDNPMLFTTVSPAQFKHQNYTTAPIKIDSSWFLATWSANPNSIVSNRPSANKLLDAFDQLAELSDSGPLETEDVWDAGDDDADMEDFITLSLVQMLSWVSFETTNSSSSTASIDHPFTGPRPQIFTWAYGMKAHPRSEILAIIVALSGCVVVLIQCALATAYRDRHWSTSQLLAAALQYAYQKDFDGLGAGDVSQVPFKLRGDDSSAVGFKFEKAD